MMVCHVPTTIGDEEAVTTDKPFQSINAVERTSAKLRTCARVCRVFVRLEDKNESIVVIGLLMEEGSGVSRSGV